MAPMSPRGWYSTHARLYAATRPACRRSGRRHAAPELASHASFSRLVSTSPSPESTIVLPVSRAETRQMGSACSSTQRPRIRISSDRSRKLEPAHTRCAARARSAAACTSARLNTGAVPRKAPVAGSWHGMDEGEGGGGISGAEPGVGHTSSSSALPRGSRTLGMDECRRKRM
eukprot:scaffold4356_cov99-Isochrysis_galbana.AAC.2